MDKLEVLSDLLLGLVINYWVTYYMLHLLGFEILYSQNAAISVVTFCLAYIRKYSLRRAFSNLIKRMYDQRRLD